MQEDAKEHDSPTVSPTHHNIRRQPALKKAVEAERTQDMADAAREENADMSTQTKPEGATTPPGTPTKWKALQKTAEANKPPVNHQSTEWRTSKKGAKTGEDLPESNGQDQGAAAKELPKGSCQGQESTGARNTPGPLPGAGSCRCP